MVATQYDPYQWISVSDKDAFKDRICALQTTFDSGVAELNTRIQAAVAAVNDSNISVVEVCSAFAGSTKNLCNANYNGIADFNLDFHPNQAGHNLIADTITAKLFEGLDLKVGGIPVTSNNADDVLEDGGTVTYNIATNTLTLNNATISEDANYGIEADGDLTIELVGHSTVENENVPFNSGIFIQGDFTFTGNGSLIAVGNINGIQIVGGNIEVYGSTVTGHGKKYGIFVDSPSEENSGKIIVIGGTVNGIGDSDDGIYLTNSLTISENAVVKATNGLRDGSDPAGTGIVFIDQVGAVYGNVTLQDELTIEVGERLTIPAGASLNSDGKLTNKGTIDVENGGTLKGTITGKQLPAINTQPTGQTVTEGNTASFTIVATGDTLSYQWQQSTSSGSNWTDIANATGTSYTTPATTIDMSGDQYRCVVTGTGGSVTSSPAALTVTAAPTYTIAVQNDGNGAATADKDTAKQGEIVTLTATPDSGYRFTGWTSSNGGTFGNASSASTTFTMPASDVTVTAQFEKVVTGVSLDKATLELFTGNTATLTATVQPSDATNQNVTWSSNNADVATVEGGTVTAVGAGETTITVQTQDGNYTATCQVTVTQPSSGGTPAKTPSQQALDKIEAAKDGATVEITLRTGQTTLNKEVFEELAGRDVTLKVNLPGGVSWTVNGQDIPTDLDFTDLDLGVSLNTSTIPVDVINLVTEEKGSIQLALAHDGEFGFTLTLTAPLGVENKGLWANLYHYDTTLKQMLFETSAQVDASGNVALKFTHASEYAIVLDEKSHELPFTDVGKKSWYTAAVQYVYQHGIMTGTSATTFEPGTPLSRAMVAQILYNLEGKPDVSTEDSFSDAAGAGQWAVNAIAWAKQTDVVSGYGDGTFRPNQAVTREELAQMLYNYAQYKGIILPAMGDLTKFPDGGKVSSWAEIAMSWANGLGIINGYEDSTLRPGGSTTRAEAASMIMSLSSKLTK